MPSAMHPQAKFDPIPPDLDLHALVDRTPNFEWVLRISAAQMRSIGAVEFEKLVFLHVIQGGKPLVIEKWNQYLPKSVFSADWLEQTHDKKQEDVRDINAQSNIPMTTGHYLRSMKQLADQWTSSNYRDERRQRLYLKDIDCPVEWQDRLRKVIPPILFYMNGNVEDKGAARDDDMFMDEQTVAPAGDLMSSLPEDMRAQNLMCYIGHEGTYTPAHREMCASLGQNIMVEASGDENGEKPGSSIWFMTESKDREVVREYFLSILGHDIEIEKHFAQINAWKKATFPVYIVEQKVGDFILVPPLAPHQVWNRGTRTMKVAWNRTTVDTLRLALYEALPKTRLVCRDEQYKNKAIIYFTLKKYYDMMQAAEENEMSWLGIGQDIIRNSLRMRQIEKDFKELLKLFTDVLVDEMFGNKEKDVELVPFDSFITCSYCRCNIFNRFLTCKHCVRDLVNGDQDTYDICMECYAMGRSCICISRLSWCEQWQWPELVDNYEAWRTMVIKNDGIIDLENSPLPLEIARKKTRRKSVAQICQEQLRRRPFKDITKQDPPSDLEPSEPEVDENGNIKKKQKRKRKNKKGDTYRCHVCCHKDYTYRLAFCSNPGCNEAYCFGVLWRAFDRMPQQVLQEEKWKCPKCQKICNCGGCRRSGKMDPYHPKNTLLGHDTRPVADDRSVESLVDFRLHNLNWLKAAGDDGRSHNSKRMERLRQQADAEKAKDGVLGNVIAPALTNSPNPASLDAATQQSIANDYGEHNAAIANTAVEDSGLGQVPLAPASYHYENGHEPMQIADMSNSALADESAYPDPSQYQETPMLGRERMLGMGYYEQDDTPDKILFDPYQEPSADAMVLDDEPSEYVKKTLRAAKRRARQENDDPDFKAPVSHRKKPKVDDVAQHDPLQNMDPALFEEPAVTTAPPVADTSSTTVAPAQIDGTQDDQREEEDEVEDDPFKPFTANIPSLRHSRPKVSYADEEHDVEEFNEVFIPGERKASVEAPEQQNKDPLDLAADAIRAITGMGTPTESSTPQGRAAGKTPAKARHSSVPGRKRGRPPRKSDPGPAAPGPQKRRGRPPKFSLAAAAAALDDATGSEAVDDNTSLGVTVDELEAQLTRELHEANDEDGGESASGIAPVDIEAPPKRRRGRPPKNQSAAKPSPAPASKSTSAAKSTNSGFLSMAERMALRGKSFKIGRKSDGTGSKEQSAQPTPTPTTEEPSQDEQPAEVTQEEESTEAPVEESLVQEESVREPDDSPLRVSDSPDEELVVSPLEGDYMPSSPDLDNIQPELEPTPEPEPEPQPESDPTPEPSPPKPRGPTVVRLGDSDEEGSDEVHSAAEDDDDSSSGSDFDDDDDDDDEGIPARKPALATRGRVVPSRGRGGSTRGRGGVATRGRGRGGRTSRGGRAVARWS